MGENKIAPLQLQLVKEIVYQGLKGTGITFKRSIWQDIVSFFLRNHKAKFRTSLAMVLPHPMLRRLFLQRLNYKKNSLTYICSSAALKQSRFHHSDAKQTAHKHNKPLSYIMALFSLSPNICLWSLLADKILSQMNPQFDPRQPLLCMLCSYISQFKIQKGLSGSGHSTFHLKKPTTTTNL